MVRKILALFLALTFLLTCAHRRDPQAAFDRAMQTFRHGDMAEATEQAEAGYKEFHNISPEWAWNFRILEANALVWRGLYDRALALLTSEPSAPPAGETTVDRDRLEGVAYTALPNFALADKTITDAEQLCAPFYYPACVDLTLARGGLEMQMGHFARAEAAFKQTLALARSHGNTFAEANALLSLGWAALQQEHFDETLSWSAAAYERAVAIDAGHIAQTALGNEGWAYYRLGEPEKALALLLDAGNRAHKISATTYEVTWLTTAGYVYLDAHDYDKAEKYYQQAYGLAQQTSKQDVLDALMSLALVSERKGNLPQARDYADKTIALAPKDGNRLDVLYPMMVKGHVAARMHETTEAEKIFREIEQDPKSHVFLKWEAEHSLAQLYEDENKPGSADHEYRAALTTFETARSSLQHEESSLPFPANASRIYDDYIHFLVGQNKPAEALQVADYDRGRTLAEGLGFLKKGTSFTPDPPNAPAIASKAGGVILFYWLGEKQSYLWAITGKKTNVFTLPAKSEIEPVALRYRKALSEQQEFLPTADADGRALYQMLVAPAATMLSKDAKVFIIPDGSLNTLNFETLLVPGTSPRYWIEDVTIADASSLRLLAAARVDNKPTGSLLLIGDAVSPSADYPELRKAGAEIQNVDKHFPAAKQQIFAREHATPAAYLESKPEQFSYIHFVAHGTASRTNPLDSAIVLSKAGAADDSFKLYARDIVHHPLHAELVTISTCYGAGSRAYSGEGLVGLSWAFLRTGAHNVIGALWEVSDASTPGLMDDLYAGLKKRERPEAALRAAKLGLLHSGGSFAKPFYWAPFQLYTGS